MPRNMEKIMIVQPDDWHLHLRDGIEMTSVVKDVAKQFGRAIVMPNLSPPIVDCEQASAYRQRILQALNGETSFNPLMTLYLTETTPADEILKITDSESIHAVKYYPAGATTWSDWGVTDIKQVYKVFEAMQQHQVPLLVHGEVANPEVDIFDREAVFIERVLIPLVSDFPELRIVLEHISTQEAVKFVSNATSHIAATITPQHLLFNRNVLFHGGLRPHHYCLPILKAETHRRAVVAAALSGSRKFFLGTDSAPHSISAKHSACGCAGIYSTPVALPLYAEVFEAGDSLQYFEAFASLNGAAFYQLPPNCKQISLVRKTWQIPAQYSFGDSAVVPLKAGEVCQWQVAV